MPVVNLQMVTAEATREQKAQIVAEFTDTLVRVLGKNPERTHIIITEKDPEDWGFAGKLVADQQAKPKS
jgi:4-oxalocrotonate tautomerase